MENVSIINNSDFYNTSKLYDSSLKKLNLLIPLSAFNEMKFIG
jgi:hypothetical protein